MQTIRGETRTQLLKSLSIWHLKKKKKIHGIGLNSESTRFFQSQPY